MVALILAAALTLAPMQAWAECARVLWAAPPDATRSEMFPEAGYDTREPCERRAEEENRVGGTVWVCLPDTIDPRGPKETRR